MSPTGELQVAVGGLDRDPPSPSTHSFQVPIFFLSNILHHYIIKSHLNCLNNDLELQCNSGVIFIVNITTTVGQMIHFPDCVL